MSDDGAASGPLCRVVFGLPEALGADTAAVAGDFNDWSLTSRPLTRAADGSIECFVDVAVGRRYHYRYFINGGQWENDWKADGYEPNAYGGDDSIFDLTPNSPRVKLAPNPCQKSATRPGNPPPRAGCHDEHGLLRAQHSPQALQRPDRGQA